MKKHLIFAAAALLAACTADNAALDSITADALMAHVRALASDEFEGRAPATKGEELTVRYLTEQFQKMGLKPGNPDGAYVQKVGLVGIKPTTTVEIVSRGRRLRVAPRENFVALSRRFTPEVKVRNSDIVFVGYGVVAAEYDWDDYKGADLKGKTLLMLVNDPAIPDPSDASKLDEKMFKGRAMTYYGRWTYKYEIASEQGAAAALIVHETGPAGYPFAVVGGSWGREDFEIQRADGNRDRVAVEGWMTYDKAAELVSHSGMDLAALKQAALKKDFRPIPLKAKASFHIKNTLREVESANVVAKLEGAREKDEYVVYTAHWDHLGRDESLTGDQIFNGALDNASGTAALLEIAKAYTRLPRPPRRSILFLSVTAEEKGLLGARYYAANPLYPLSKTLADINIDGVNQWGPTRDMVVVGLGNTTLDGIAEEILVSRGRIIKPDAEPEKGYYFRSDHFEFAKRGVPGFYIHSGTEFIGKPEGYGARKRAEYVARDYHKVSDEIKPDWDLSGAVADVQVLFELGHRVAEADRHPEWKPGAEFRRQ
ncbi:MAG: M28 family metallopeptidase [Bryobacteraceae bacterium]